MDDDDQPQATKVLMVIAVGVTARWRLPLAYYMTDGTNAELQQSILRTVISKLWECGSVAISVTMDGLAANIKTLQLLGCNLEPDNLRSVFPHPECPSVSVAAVLDACHMMKLARNTISEYQIIQLPDGGKAKWRHIEMLHKKQNAEDLVLGNRLTKAHIDFKNQKMKVRLAVQALSASCSKAIEYLRKSGCSDFHDSHPTEIFITKLDKLFDILNSKSTFGKGYKRAITVHNMNVRLQFLLEMKQFLLELKDSNGCRLIHSKRKTFVLGLCLTIDSVCHIIKTLMSGDGINGQKIKYLATYRLSQDNIETMFSIVRRRGGWSNNPTALQFQYIYRALLSNIGVSVSGSANVVADEVDEILSKHDDNTESVFLDGEGPLSDHTYFSCLPNLSTYVNNVCSYIAGFVVRKLQPQLKCTSCRQLLVSLPGTDAPNTCFLKLKDNGGLVTPSEGVVRIIQRAEQNYRVLIPQGSPVHSISRMGIKLEQAVITDLNCDLVFGETSHLMDTISGIDNHVTSLIRQIVRFYLKIRKFHSVKMWNIEQRQSNVRQKMTKLVLFKNE
jgi:hypothetical protein